LFATYPTTIKSLLNPTSLLWIIFTLWVAKGIKNGHYCLPLTHKLYGKVVRVAPNIVSVADKDMIREILVTTDYPKSAIYQVFDFDGMKTYSQPATRASIRADFGLQYLQSVETLMHKCIDGLLQEIDDRFGQSFETIKDDAHPVPHQLEKTIKQMMQQTFIPWMKYIDPFDFFFRDFGAACVKQRKASGEAGRRVDLLQREDSNGGSKHEDMACEEFTDKLIKLRSELDLATATNPCGSLPTYEQIRKLPYLTGCINESMRLRPTAALGIPRDVDEDVVINNYYFPKGTSIGILSTGGEYIPERWIPDESPFPPVQDFTYYPFSAGSLS
ncbi:cytochrome P450, partial [Lobosporangium transversale]